jgi:cytoskeletal protein CcmA (bactofilin family)
MDNESHAKNLNWEPTPYGDVAGSPRAHAPKESSAPKQEPGETTDRRRELSVLGQSLVFKGELEAEEDLVIDGRVEGTITHRAQHLTIGPHGNVKADIIANRVLVQGHVVGNIRATETIVIEPSAHVVGNLFAPRIGLKEGAEFDGRIQMTGASANASKTQAAEVEPRSAATKRASSPKKASAAAPGITDANIEDLLK